MVYNSQPDIEAEITFVPTNQGGRKTPAFSGYRPQFYYDGMDWDATHEYPDVEKVLPGQTVRTLLNFSRPQIHFGRVVEGMEFLVREGQRTVAHGRVTIEARSIGLHAVVWKTPVVKGENHKPNVTLLCESQ